jgi:hypothetical protein
VEAMVDEMIASSPLLKLAATGRETGGKQKVEAVMLTMLGGAAAAAADGGEGAAPPATPEAAAEYAQVLCYSCVQCYCVCMSALLLCVRVQCWVKIVATL